MRMIVMAASAAICASAFGGGKAYLSVKVVDSESGDPIQGILVHGGFMNYARGWNASAKDNDDDRKTDSNGMCRLSGETEAGSSCCIAWSNAGYYDSGWYSYDYTERSYLRFGRWMPDNVVVTVRLDRIVKPIPLFVAASRSVPGNGGESVFSGSGEVASYDMLENDWLPPWGNGSVADICFSCKRTVLGREPYRYPRSGVVTNEFFRCDVPVRFLGEDNGMIEEMPSEQAGIKLRVAPESGYGASRICQYSWVSRTEFRDNFDKNRCYYVRIRTERDEHGKIKKAFYGKIYGDFKLEGTKKGVKGVSFLYYLNPTPLDRNLEWDRKNNLCPKPGDIGVPRP